MAQHVFGRHYTIFGRLHSSRLREEFCLVLQPFMRRCTLQRLLATCLLQADYSLVPIFRSIRGGKNSWYSSNLHQDNVSQLWEKDRERRTVPIPHLMSPLYSHIWWFIWWPGIWTCASPREDRVFTGSPEGRSLPHSHPTPPMHCCSIHVPMGKTSLCTGRLPAEWATAYPHQICVSMCLPKQGSPISPMVHHSSIKPNFRCTQSWQWVPTTLSALVFKIRLCADGSAAPTK